ncbi:metalloregulator ArsR/SmtB family transcription factor [Pontibacillus yanchengensis]|uniref:Metalloregulator ArsR/SmtB family transcription factor n=2 Tax=Pontibacillus yanchengensis TaxID=462910 RepID=A0ACC7VJ63_9BACI|nr:metalloregulator ArsR/SmtB family transcription factor [Pontibacillus yanchengensis]MYL54828.1 metalloregulator ArsR/SmtB family transcription factor [Pontibacillus yanchengensis]
MNRKRLIIVKELPIIQPNENIDFASYVHQFKALADEKRLLIMNILTRNGKTCVCDLEVEVNLPQSKLSYHLKILYKAGFIHKETKGTWSYYWINETVVNSILSEDLCCLFRPN